MTANVVNQIPYLRSSRQFPTDINQLVVEISKAYIDIANVVNNRTISIFPTINPAITGESWFLTSQKQQTLRKVFRFGSIAPGTELDIPININNFTEFTRIYGTVVTNVPDYRPLPFVSTVAVNQNISLLVGPIAGINNVRIILGAAATPVVRGIVVLEWLSSV